MEVVEATGAVGHVTPVGGSGGAHHGEGDRLTAVTLDIIADAGSAFLVQRVL